MPSFIGFPELIVLAIVLLLIFGPKRLPEIGRSMGKGMREFKDSITGKDDDDDDAITSRPVELAAPPAEPPPPAATTTPAPTPVERDHTP
jgi:sec-independent protein translocase protein TatA